MFFWSSSCHAFDKILCLSLRLDTMLATPAYQASIDTLRHSITSRKILYTTFWFLSIPFGKIIGKNKKKSDSFLGSDHVLFINGKIFILLHLFWNADFEPAERAGASPVYGEVGGVHFDAAAARSCKTEFAVLMARRGGIFAPRRGAEGRYSFTQPSRDFRVKSLTLIFGYVIIYVII